MTADPTGAAATADTAAAPAISLDGVEKVFRRGKAEVHAVTSTSFTVRAGEFVSLLGPSGCGKSTLLRMILGLETPTSGTVLVQGEPPARSQGRIGVMLQTPALVPWRTVQGNVLLPARLRGVPNAQVSGAVDELLAMVGLSAFAGSYPGALSGGMQQRVALARALLFDPELLVLDEPFGALDHITREQLNDELAALCAGSGKTTILVTHDIDEAIYLSDRIVVMSARPGRVEAVLDVGLAKPRDLTSRRRPEFEDLALRIRGLLGLGSIGARSAAPDG